MRQRILDKVPMLLVIVLCYSVGYFGGLLLLELMRMVGA